MQTQMCTLTCEPTDVHPDAVTNTDTEAQMHAYAHRCAAHTDAHTCTCTHTDTCTHRDAHRHTHTPSHIPSPHRITSPPPLSLTLRQPSPLLPPASSPQPLADPSHSSWPCCTDWQGVAAGLCPCGYTWGQASSGREHYAVPLVWVAVLGGVSMGGKVNFGGLCPPFTNSLSA